MMPFLAIFGQTSGVPPWVWAILQGGALLILAYKVIIIDPQQRRDDTAEREKRANIIERLVKVLEEKVGKDK